MIDPVEFIWQGRRLSRLSVDLPMLAAMLTRQTFPGGMADLFDFMSDGFGQFFNILFFFLPQTHQGAPEIAHGFVE